jgi:hypothetical protein
LPTLQLLAALPRTRQDVLLLGTAALLSPAGVMTPRRCSFNFSGIDTMLQLLLLGALLPFAARAREPG